LIKSGQEKTETATQQGLAINLFQSRDITRSDCRKGIKLKTALTFFTVAALGVIAGCSGTVKQKNLFSVNFQKNQTLRYKFVSSRDIDVNWGRIKSRSKQTKSAVDKSTESMDMVVAYTPVEVDPYGLTTIKATCESVKVKRSKGPQRDAVKSFAGRSFTFTVDATGKIEDYSQLDKLIEEIGKKAFRQGEKTMRIKDPDMIGDFISSQWFLWDSISSIEKPAEGMLVGQSWNSKLSIPTPMVMRKARDVTYTLSEIRQTKTGRIAVIKSTYSPSKSVPPTWPIPYKGSFSMKGKFGFLRHYRILDLQGGGTELFNMDGGRIEQYKQHYQMKLSASLLIPLPGAAPQITIKQNLTMQLLGSR